MGVKLLGLDEVIYDEAATTTTYEKSVDWSDEVALLFDINNIGASSLTFVINEDGVTRTVLSLQSMGWKYKAEITKVVITATDSYQFLLRG